MELHEKELLIGRIKSGCVLYRENDKKIYIRKPTLLIEYEGQELYFEMLQDGEEYGLMSDNEIYEWMLENGLWTLEKEKQLNDILPKHIEYWKEEIYKSFLRVDHRKTLKKYLQAAKNELNKLFEQRHQFDYTTLEGYAKYCKNLFFIKNSCFDENGNKVDVSELNITTLLSYYFSGFVSEDNLRELAKTTPWSEDWHALKKNGRIFEHVDLTTNQKNLILWSTLYDNIRESPDCPIDEIVEDDDMLDGWLITQRKKREGDRKRAEVESGLNKNSKLSKADEIYFVASSIEEAKRIDDLNTAQAKMIKKNRLAQVEKLGSVKEQSFSDSILKQNMLATQAYSSKMKRR